MLLWAVMERPRAAIRCCRGTGLACATAACDRGRTRAVTARRNGWAKKPEATEPTPLQYLKRCPLVDASDMTPEEFARRFGEPNVPVLLAGLTDDWPATRKWTVQVSSWARARAHGGSGCGGSGCARGGAPWSLPSATCGHQALPGGSRCGTLLVWVWWQNLYRKFRHVRFRVGDDNEHMAVMLKLKCVAPAAAVAPPALHAQCPPPSARTCSRIAASPVPASRPSRACGWLHRQILHRVHV